MTTPSNTQLREALQNLEVPKMVVWVDKEMKVETTNLVEKTVDEILALFQEAQHQLLTEIVEQAVEVNTVQYNYDNGDKMIAGFTNSAVPVSVIEKYLKANSQAQSQGDTT